MKRVERLKKIANFEMDETKTIPLLNSKNANKAISALIVYYENYMNYDECSDNNCLLYAFGELARKIRNNECYTKEELANIFLKTNTTEHTRACGNYMDLYAKTIIDLGKNRFLDLLHNKNKKYELIDILLNADGAKEKNLSLISKTCFHMANAIYGKDCNYSKYDNIVKSNLYKYFPVGKYNERSFRTFKNNHLDKYIEYCNAIGELCKHTHLSRNDIDQIIWVYFKNK